MSARLLQPTPILLTGRCHITVSTREKYDPLRCDLSSKFFDHLLGTWCYFSRTNFPFILPDDKMAAHHKQLAVSREITDNFEVPELEPQALPFSKSSVLHWHITLKLRLKLRSSVEPWCAGYDLTKFNAVLRASVAYSWLRYGSRRDEGKMTFCKTGRPTGGFRG